MRSPDETFIRSTEDLAAFWHDIDGGFGWSAPQLFAVHIDTDGSVSPAIMQFYDDELADGPDQELLDGFVRVHTEVLTRALPGGSLAVLKARPGGPVMTPADRAWCTGLHRALHDAPFASYPLFFATDAGVGIVPPDELVAAA
ncbi:MAG TPA: hypothetical protein VGE77_00195 [Nocardioides sp.]